jgi:catechol 2,3-dioxygenase-like lactoylglutathione lyase family enzyme
VIRGIHHVALITPNFDSLVAFYRDVIGAEEIYNRHETDEALAETIGAMTGLPGLPRTYSAMLRLGNAFIEIQQYVEPEGRGDETERPPNDFGIRHFAIEVEGVEAEIERLEKAGLRLEGRLASSPLFPVKAVYTRDPDGNLVELVEWTADDSPLPL